MEYLKLRMVRGLHTLPNFGRLGTKTKMFGGPWGGTPAATFTGIGGGLSGHRPHRTSRSWPPEGERDRCSRLKKGLLARQDSQRWLRTGMWGGGDPLGPLRSRTWGDQTVKKSVEVIGVVVFPVGAKKRPFHRAGLLEGCWGGPVSAMEGMLNPGKAGAYRNELVVGAFTVRVPRAKPH